MNKKTVWEPLPRERKIVSAADRAEKALANIHPVRGVQHARTQIALRYKRLWRVSGITLGAVLLVTGTLVVSLGLLLLGVLLLPLGILGPVDLSGWGLTGPCCCHDCEKVRYHYDKDYR